MLLRSFYCVNTDKYLLSCTKIDDIKSFRNRVNHCEPLCFVGHNIDCSFALDIRTKLYSLIEWIDPDMVPFFESMDNIQNKINQIMRI